MMGVTSLCVVLIGEWVENKLHLSYYRLADVYEARVNSIINNYYNNISLFKNIIATLLIKYLLVKLFNTILSAVTELGN